MTAVRLLLQFDSDQSSISWDIALAYAAEHGNIQMVRMFLDAGALTSVKYARFCLDLKNNNFDAESIFEISRPHHALLN
jgi:hypothetical protein